MVSNDHASSPLYMYIPIQISSSTSACLCVLYLVYGRLLSPRPAYSSSIYTLCLLPPAFRLESWPDRMKYHTYGTPIFVEIEVHANPAMVHDVRFDKPCRAIPRAPSLPAAQSV